MIIEVYLDTSRLKESQTLVIVDEDGKRWDVIEQLSNSSHDDSSGVSGRVNDVVLERWRIELDLTGGVPTDDFGPTLPTIYKKAIVFFRSLFSCANMLPAWNFASHEAARNSHQALTPRIRVRDSERDGRSIDRLRAPIGPRGDAVTDYVFGDLEVPVGRLRTSVTYRNDCHFRIDDSEALLSSRLMGVDENFFRPSLPQSHERSRPQVAEVGSLRDHRHHRSISDVHQTYGSLSTFHGDGPIGTSPISALRAVKPPGSDTSSPPASLPHHDVEVPNSLPISARPSSARPHLRNEEGHGRRPSISFQPFKAGSLSGSPIPRQADSDRSASPHSLNRPGDKPPSLSSARNRTSLTAGMPASLRGGPQSIPTSDPAPSSPRPGASSRYSSSFTHRRSRPSLSGVGKSGDDEQTSSGRQSLASSAAQPGSGLFAEPGGSSGSFQDEDNIQKFLEAIESKKTLQKFDTGKKGESATNKTVAQLSKFHMMKESNNALTESMSSSVQMQRSSSSSSRQLTSVPGMASASAGSSPGKGHSPHTPHTPAIPSRLSANSVADDEPSTNQRRFSSRQIRPTESTVPEVSRENTMTQDGPSAIDIPLSPRLTGYQRRSSSVAQRSRAVVEEDADLPFANRSLSLGADDREPPTMSGLLGRQLANEGEAQQPIEDLQPASETQTAESSTAIPRVSSDDPPSDGFMSGVPSSSPFGRRRYTGMGSRQRQTPPQSGRGSFAGSINRSARGDDESLSEEPLVFDLSEMDAQGRRSLEEGRGGGHIGADRGGYDSRASSRRGGW